MCRHCKNGAINPARADEQPAVNYGANGWHGAGSGGRDITMSRKYRLLYNTYTYIQVLLSLIQSKHCNCVVPYVLENLA